MQLFTIAIFYFARQAKRLTELVKITAERRGALE
jgi:hypothetical protein